MTTDERMAEAIHRLQWTVPVPQPERNVSVEPDRVFGWLVAE